MKYPYKKELVEHYVELFKKEKINSIKEFVTNQEKLSPEIVKKYDDFQPIPYNTFYKALRKREDFNNLKGEKIGNGKFKKKDYNKKKKDKEKEVNKKTDNETENETDNNDGGADDLEIKKDIEELDRIKNNEKKSSDSENNNKDNEITETETKNEIAGFELNPKNIAIGIGLLTLVIGSGYYLYKSYKEGGEYVDYEREKENENTTEKRGSETGAGEIQNGNDGGYFRPDEL